MEHLSILCSKRVPNSHIFYIVSLGCPKSTLGVQKMVVWLKPHLTHGASIYVYRLNIIYLFVIKSLFLLVYSGQCSNYHFFFGGRDPHFGTA